MFRFARHKTARFAGFGVAVILGALLSQHTFAADFSSPAEAEFRTFAVDELTLGMPRTGSSEAIKAGSLTTIPGYPLSQEELNLVLDTSERGSEFRQQPADAEFVGEQDRQPFRVRVVTWIKQRSSDFNLFKLFDTDESEPGLHLDVDTDEEELVLQYRVGF